MIANTIGLRRVPYLADRQHHARHRPQRCQWKLHATAPGCPAPCLTVVAAVAPQHGPRWDWSAAQQPGLPPDPQMGGQHLPQQAAWLSQRVRQPLVTAAQKRPQQLTASLEYKAQLWHVWQGFQACLTH